MSTQRERSRLSGRLSVFLFLSIIANSGHFCLSVFLLVRKGRLWCVHSDFCQFLHLLLHLLFSPVLLYLLGLFLRVDDVHRLFTVLAWNWSIVIVIRFLANLHPSFSGVLKFGSKLKWKDSFEIVGAAFVGEFDFSSIVDGYSFGFVVQFFLSFLGFRLMFLDLLGYRLCLWFDF